ncbi:MAG: alpha-hydroxy-acid oxidizing protein [Anaerovoracaceae bacterium]|nr:alpha-hydroxy-acid oxidizing protein [Anaerovoracaceae bacterium]
MKNFETWEDIRKNAREQTAPHCNACPACNGRACAGKAPGPGGKASGASFMRNYDYLHDHIKLVMRSLGAPFEPDTSVGLFGRTLSMPVMAAPVGMLEFSYGVDISDPDYDRMLLTGLNDAGTIGFTGGGAMKMDYFYDALDVIKEIGNGIPTIKPWALEFLEGEFRRMEDACPAAIAMDVDSAGLAHGAMFKYPMVRKTGEDLRRIAAMTDIPFIVKGVMTADEAEAAADAGAYAIVVSNHGGRVIDESISTAEAMPEIVSAVGGRVKIFADGGIRTGYDVFKMLALGADAVLIGRPFITAVIGGGAEGARFYAEKLAGELKDAMNMTGCAALGDISGRSIRIV